MRRKEKSIIDRNQIDRIIHESQICHLACSQDDRPYVIPLSFGYDGKSVYFHTAQTGKKNEIFLTNPQVCLSFETNIKLIADSENACGWTFDFFSVIATGKIEEVKDPVRKISCLNQIMRHYTGEDWKIPDRDASKTAIWQVIIKTITGKRSPAEDRSKTP